MKSKRISPAMQKALDLLDGLIRSDEARSTGRLPPIKKLAKQAGVSLVTMWKAASILKEQDKIDLFPGQGITVKIGRLDSAQAFSDEQIRQAHKELSSLHTWTRVKAEIEKCILNGMFARGSLLPGMKELQQQFGTSFPTLKKALNRMLEDGIIVARKRRFAVPSLAQKESDLRIIILKPKDLWGKSLFHETAYDSLLKFFEIECSRIRIKLEILDYRMSDGAFELTPLGSESAVSFPSSQDIQGYCFLHQLNETAHIEIMRQIAATGKPAAIFDTTEDAVTVQYCKPGKRHHIFTVTSGFQSGLQAALCLLERAHKKIAFISPYHKWSWSQNRLEGVQSAYIRAGQGKAVHLFAFDKLDSTWKFYQQAREQFSFDTLADVYNSWLEKIPPHTARHIDLVMEWALRKASEHAGIDNSMHPLFEQALRKKDITAWVCANDLVGLMAYEFLQQRNIAVPGKISLFGFDNSLLARKIRLTSYDFNLPAIASAMLHHVLWPGNPLQRSRRRMTTIDGDIVYRESTRISMAKKGRSTRTG